MKDKGRTQNRGDRGPERGGVILSGFDLFAITGLPPMAGADDASVQLRETPA